VANEKQLVHAVILPLRILPLTGSFLHLRGGPAFRTAFIRGGD
jgi:hypothetical protein